MAYDLFNPDVQPEVIYYNYATTLVQPTITTNITGDTTIITTINGGGGGQASGPNVTFSGGTTGLNFIASGNTISLEGTLVVANGGTGATTATGARGNLGAAASGVNTDITQLNGASQVDVSGVYKVSGTQVVAGQQPAIANPAGGVTVDAEARTAIDDILDALRNHGLIGI